MDAVERTEDRIASTGERPVGTDNLNEQRTLPKEEGIISARPSTSAAITSRDDISKHKPSVSSGDSGFVYPVNAHSHPIIPEGYEVNSSTWNGYPHYGSADSLQIVPPVIYNDNPSVVFHPDYGFNPQMAYGQYSPVATALPSMMLDGQLYSSQQLPFSPSYYPHPLPPTVAPNVSSADTGMQTELMVPESGGQEVVNDSMLFGPGSGYFVHFGSFNGDVSGNAGFYNLQGEFGSVESLPSQSSQLNANWSMSTLPSPGAYAQPFGMQPSHEHNVQQISPLPRPQHGFGLISPAYSNHYLHEDSYPASSFVTASVSHSRANERSGFIVERGGRRERDWGSVSVSPDLHDFATDRNRGPRASKAKIKSSAEKGLSSSTSETSSYNHQDFLTTYENAKFFIIKSFSEDNVHKSIKYGVWASTTLGNGKLDAAFSEAKEIKGSCPVFLLFSVNASSQFCGVAEMVGPVDFENNADYWQQDRWSGRFPIKWHIIKDVPNSRFRHILLENNENKPVTHSRDTQEVKLEQGVEMLKIFKDYEARTCILDDFIYYDERERALQERKGRQQAITNESVNQMSDCLAQKLQLEQGKEAHGTTDKDVKT